MTDPMLANGLAIPEIPDLTEDLLLLISCASATVNQVQGVMGDEHIDRFRDAVKRVREAVGHGARLVGGEDR